jgi:hypothetical protein
MTQPVARLTGLQMFTLVLALFGSYQIIQFQRIGQLEVQSNGRI